MMKSIPPLCEEHDRTSKICPMKDEKVMVHFMARCGQIYGKGRKMERV